MRLMTRKQFRVYIVLVVCLTGIFYMTVSTLFLPRDPVTIYSVQNYLLEFPQSSQNATTEFSPFAALEKNQRIAEMCRNKDVRRFIRNAPYVTQKRLFYNNTEVCTCNVPKAASTSVGRLMLMAEFPEKAAHYSRIPGNKVHVTKGTAYYNTERCADKPGLSFFVTRDPYARLYSAYVDKVFLEKFGYLSVLIDAVCNKRISKDILTKTTDLKELAKKNNWMCKVGNATFEQFLLYVTKTRHIDPHYTPVSLLCNPCKDPVDHIFKQENLQEDSKVLSHYLNLTVNVNRTEKVDLQLQDYIGDSGVENLIRTYHTAWQSRLLNNNCTLNEDTHRAIYERLWDAMKMLGNIDESLDYIPELFHDYEFQLKDPEIILQQFVDNNIILLNKEERARQRRKYLVNAYKSVNSKVLTDIQTLFQLDFEFFDYDINPPE